MKMLENRLDRKSILQPIKSVCTCLFAVVLTGCGGGTPTAPAPQPSSQSSNATPNTQVAQNAKKQPAKTSEKKVKDDRKMIDGIPYDVWFDNPLAVAANSKSVTPVALPGTSVANSTAASTSPNATKTTETQEPSPTGGVDWKTIIPMPVVEAQVKEIRNRLTRNMQSVGTYNTSYLELPTFTATLAALAGIVTEHPEDIGWKKNAKYLRDLSAAFTAEPLMRGAKSFRKVQIPYEQMIVILNGSLPADVPKSEDKIPLSDVASMGDLMKRADIASKWLKSNVGSADALKAEKEKVINEAHLLAAIAKVITTEGYGYVDDEGFLGYANPMSDACLKMVAAAKSDNYEEFDQGLTQVYKACTQCHSEYKE
ncbi:cytochrome c [Gimesia aquarii]|uniref:Cytochrome C n=1 Tax=Gimesia aquarii TaxID=2527964 RepID=A0A517X0V2_9PLAN|nr:cytochrome c [Gimesia aquarii]QDU11122.1 hypothetical protein V202x_45380 [Gimesia aquarii]